MQMKYDALKNIFLDFALGYINKTEVAMAICLYQNMNNIEVIDNRKKEAVV